MRNICKSFIIYNHFLPPSKDTHSWQYLSFGYYDGIDVEDNLFGEQSQGNLNEELAKLWNYYVERNEKLDGSFSEQVVLGLRTETEGSLVKDSDFWKEENRENYPFLFISLIQAESGSQKNIHKKIEDLEVGLSNSERKVITYFTFDTSDLLMVMLCKNYDDGVEAIENFHCPTNNKLKMLLDYELKYSYTIAAVDKKILNDSEQVKAIPGIIKRADVYLIEKKQGSIERIFEKLNEDVRKDESKSIQIEKKSVLGCNDEVIRLENIPWNRFLLYYQDVTGFFDNANENYKDGIMGITTIIQASKSNTDKVSEDEVDKTEAETVCILLSDVMRRKCKRINFDCNEEYIDISGMKRNMYQVINSLQKFEETMLRDYLFQSALLPLNMMLDIATELTEKVATKTEKRRFCESFYIFMKGFNLFVQDSGRSDRQFTQVPDFNARIYDTPVKMNAFYNAFVFYMKNYLNDLYDREAYEDKPALHEYEFLACPGVTDNMQVRECFVGISEDKRLFLVEVPEKQVYKPKQMLIMLAHEVAHFVGSDVRNRDKRFESIKEICVELIVNCLKLEVKRVIKNDNAIDFNEIYSEVSSDTFWGIFREQIKENIELHDDEYRQYYMSKFVGEGKDGNLLEEQRQVLLKNWKYRNHHSEMVVNVLGDLLTDKLCEKGEELWAYLVEAYHISLIEHGSSNSEQKKERLRAALNQYVAKISSISIWSSEMLTIKAALEMAMGIFKESIADLICILTLGLSLEDYLDTIVSSAKDQGTGIAYIENSSMLRIVLVTASMEKKTCENDMVWGKEQLGFYGDGREELTFLWESIRNMREDFIVNEEKVLQQKLESADETTLKVIDALYDGDIIKIFLRYLCTCKADFAKFNSQISGGKGNNEWHDKIKTAYELFGQPSMEQMLFGMNELTENYLTELQKLIKQAVEERSESE